MQCPICTKALEHGELVMVCAGCHNALGGVSALSVGATGEFRVPLPHELEEPPETNAPGERPHATPACSWCGKREAEVKKLLGRAGTALCDECVALASDILDAELGNSWR